MKLNTLIFHYGEVALKTGNRLFFEQTLAQNIHRILTPLGVNNVRVVRGRLLANITETTDLAQVRQSVPFLFGVVNVVLSVRTNPTLQGMSETACALMKEAPPGTFKVDTLRSDKQFPKTSMEINAELGGVIISATGRTVNVHRPDVVCSVELLEKDAYVSVETITGPGGLPTGSQSPLLSLLSGGIDSPVASLRMQRRGASVVGVHFFSYPFTNRASVEKVKELAAVIARSQGNMTVYGIPFAEVQKASVKYAPPELRVILYRRSMFRIAQALATREGIQGLVTGESLGQVASQTVENMAAVQSAITLPVFRPLIGMNKEEIMDEARVYGTYDISIRPHEDCCSLFLPEHPETRAKLNRVREAEAAIIGLADLETAALASVEIWGYHPSSPF